MPGTFHSRSGRGKKVLAVIISDLRSGGVPLYLAERLPRLARTCGSNITLLVPGKIEAQELADKFTESGVRVVACNLDLKSNSSLMQGIREHVDRLLSEEHFDVVHVNTGKRVVLYAALQPAKRHKVPTRIAHSHSAPPRKGPAKRIVGAWLRLRVNALATDLLACSDDAGRSAFGESAWKRRGVVAKNGVDIERFSFSSKAREQARNEYGVPHGARVVGYVGRLETLKNPVGTIEIAIALCKRDPALVFWVVGDGSYRARLEEMVNEQGLSERITFFGVKSNAEYLINGMDALVLPSLYEGLGISLIEAQSVGVPCFASDRIPQEAHIPGCPLEFIPLEAGPDVWAERILSSDLARNPSGASMVEAAGYSVELSTKTLVPYYGSID